MYITRTAKIVNRGSEQVRGGGKQYTKMEKIYRSLRVVVGRAYSESARFWSLNLRLGVVVDTGTLSPSQCKKAGLQHAEQSAHQDGSWGSKTSNWEEWVPGQNIEHRS